MLRDDNVKISINAANIGAYAFTKSAFRKDSFDRQLFEIGRGKKEARAVPFRGIASNRL